MLDLLGLLRRLEDLRVAAHHVLDVHAPAAARVGHLRDEVEAQALPLLNLLHHLVGARARLVPRRRLVQLAAARVPAPHAQCHVVAEAQIPPEDVLPPRPPRLHVCEREGVAPIVELVEEDAVVLHPLPAVLADERGRVDAPASLLADALQLCRGVGQVRVVEHAPAMHAPPSAHHLLLVLACVGLRARRDEHAFARPVPGGPGVAARDEVPVPRGYRAGGALHAHRALMVEQARLGYVLHERLEERPEQLAFEDDLHARLVAALLLRFLVLVRAEEADLRAVLETDGQFRLVRLDPHLVACGHVDELLPQKLLRAQAVDGPDADEAPRLFEALDGAVARPHRGLARATGAERRLVPARVVDEGDLLVEQLRANSPGRQPRLCERAVATSQLLCCLARIERHVTSSRRASRRAPR